MSIFKKKLEKFFGTAWDNEYEKTLTNYLMQHRAEIMKDEASGQGYIQTFAEANADLLEMCSPEFKEAIQALGLYMTESQEFSGYWENVSLKISDELGMKISPDDIKRIKAMAFNKFGIKVNEKDNKPVDEIIVMKLPIIQIGRFEREIKKINSDLTANAVDLNAVNYNIAPRMNRIEKEKGRDTVIENTTADIAAFDTPIALYRRRLSEYDPYGTAVNKKDKKDKSIIKTTFDKVNKAMEAFDLQEAEVVATDINEDVVFAKVIIKEGGKQRTLHLLKEMVIDYLVDFGNVNEYINWQGEFDLRKYLKSRPKFILNQVFMECIDRNLMVLKEAAIEDQCSDYNEWKAKVATATGNDYTMKRASKDSVTTIAVDSQGETVGSWDPDKLLGYIYK